MLKALDTLARAWIHHRVTSKIDRIVQLRSNGTVPTDEPVWTDRDGNRTPISMLTDRHLTNILRMYMRRAHDELEMYKKTASTIWSGYFPQGEMAQDAYWAAVEEAEEAAELTIFDVVSRYPLFFELAALAEKRGILEEPLPTD